MTALVMDWLQMEVQLPISTSQFEQGFSNGFLFGELFKRFRQLPNDETFLDHHTIEAKIQNFKRLQPVFKALGVKATSERIQEIMAGKRGAALRLLYQVKMSLENVRPPIDIAAVDPTRDAPPELVTSLRLPRKEFDAHEERYFESRLRAVAYKEADSQLTQKLAKFEEEARAQAANARELDLIDEEHAQLQRDRNRQIILEKAALNRGFIDEWQRRGHAQWKENLDRQRDREMGELRFEKRAILKKHNRIAEIREASGREVNEIEQFEKDLQQLGINTGPAEYETGAEYEQAMRTMIQTTTKADGQQELYASFTQRLPTAMEMEREAEEYLNMRKQSKLAGHLARQERECRRRKHLVEEHAAMATEEDQHVENAIMAKLLREGLEEKRISYQVWKTDRQEDVMRLHREQRAKHYKEMRREMKAHHIAIDQVIAGEELKLSYLDQQSNGRQYRDLERGRLARANERTLMDCENAVSLLIDLAEVVFANRRLVDGSRTDGSLVDPAVWEELCTAFVHSQSATSTELGPQDQAPYPFPRDPAAPAGEEVTMPPSSELTELPPHTATARMLQLPRPKAGEAAAATLSWQRAEYLGLTGPFATCRPELLDVPPQEGSHPAVEDPEWVDGEPVDYRLGTVLQQAMNRVFTPPLPAPPPDMPRVPVRLIITGKPLSGKHTLVHRLEENYNLAVIIVDDLVKECMALAGRYEADPLALESTQLNVNRDEDYQPFNERGDIFDEYTNQLKTLGHHMIACLDAGQEIPDETYVDALVNKIRAAFHPRNPTFDPKFQPSQTSYDGEPPNGWVLVGFPVTGWQYMLLERALSGYSDPGLQPRTELDTRLDACAAFHHLPPAEEAVVEARFKGGCDYHIVLDVPNEEVVRRMAGRRKDPVTGLEYHLEDKPPYPLDAVPTAQGALTATFSSTSAFRKQQQVIFERLEQADPLSNALGTIINRLHIFDVNQADIAEFAENLGNANPDTPRLVTIPDGSPDRIYDLADELVAGLLETWEQQEQYVNLPDVPGARDHDFDPPPGRASLLEPLAAPIFDKEPGVPDQDYNPDGTLSKRGSVVAGIAGAPPLEGVEPVEEPPEPPRLLENFELKELVQGLEDRTILMLTNMWLQLEGRLNREITEVLGWLRTAKRAWLAGKGEAQARMLAELAVPGTQQDAVDRFLDDVNRFSDEYPNMRPMDAAKAELHARTASLAAELEEEIRARAATAEARRQELLGSQWLEGHELVLAVLTQRLVQVELLRLSGERQVLTDFYTRASGELLQTAPPPVPRVDVLDASYAPPEEKKEEEDPKAKGKAPPKGKAPAQDTEAEEEAKRKAMEAARKPRYVTEAAVDPDTGNTVPSQVTYPLLDLLFGAALAAARDATKPPSWPPGEPAPVEEEKVEETKGKKPPAKGKKEEVKEEEEVKAPEKPMPHAWVDFHQALRSLEVRFAFRLQTLRRWAEFSLDALDADSEHLREGLRGLCALEARGERQAIDALVNTIGGHIEREEKFPCVYSLHGNKLCTHGNLLLDAPVVSVPPELRETPAAGRPSLAQLEAALGVVCALATGSGELSAASLADMRPALWPGAADAAPAAPAAAARAFLAAAPPRGDCLAVEVLLSLALVRPEDWPTERELVEVWRAQLTARGVDDVLLTEAEFIMLPLFDSALADPAGYPRPAAFRAWLYRVFAAFPALAGTEGVSLRRVLSLLALQPSVSESLRWAFGLGGYSTSDPLPVAALAEFLLQKGLRAPRHDEDGNEVVEVTPEELANLLRDIISGHSAEPAIVTTVTQTMVLEPALAAGVIEGGLNAVLEHPNLSALPLEHRWTRPAYF